MIPARLHHAGRLDAALCLVAVGVLWAAPTASGMSVYAAFGDSITMGYQVNSPWPSRLSGMIGQTVSNDGVGGKTTLWGRLSIGEIIIVTSDHGTCFGEHGMLGHIGPPVDELQHVPLILVLPGAGQAPGGVAEGLAETTDIAPTVLSYLGFRIPRRMQGRDLMPVILGHANRVCAGRRPPPTPAPGGERTGGCPWLRCLDPDPTTVFRSRPSKAPIFCRIRRRCFVVPLFMPPVRWSRVSVTIGSWLDVCSEPARNHELPRPC